APRASLCGSAQLCLMLDDPSDQAVASRFFGGQPEVAPGVLLDPLEGLSGLLRELAVQPVAHLENLTCLDLDIAGGPAGAACRLVQQEARVREAVAVFARHRDVDQGRDARHPARADHAHPWAQKAHEVVNRVPRLHVAARACRRSASAPATDTRVILFRHDRSKSVLSIGFPGRYAASAAAAIASSDRSVPASAAPASGTSCGQLATPPSAIRASTTRSPLPAPCSHFVHAATPSTGQSHEPRRRSL